MERYRKALEEAVQISCQHNVPPLPGRTVIVFSTDIVNSYPIRQDFCLPPEPEQDSDGKEEEEEDICFGLTTGNTNDKNNLCPTVRTRKKKLQSFLNMHMSIITFCVYFICVPFCQVAEVAVLLGLMIGSRAEDFELFENRKRLELKSDVLLENVRSVVKQIKVWGFLWQIMDPHFSKSIIKSTHVFA